ncbi:MAG: lipopolysaccharide heptosyltransferase II [Elusimicrobiota bacterium]
MNKRGINKILCISTTGIGNMVLYTPVIRTLDSRFPGAEITLLCSSREAGAVLEDSNIVDKIIVLDKSKAKNYFTVLKKVRRENIDMVIGSYLDRSFKVGVFAWLTKAYIRVGYRKGLQKFFYNYLTDLRTHEHEVNLNLDLLKPVKGEQVINEPVFKLTDENLKFADNFLESGSEYFGFHPGAGSQIGGGRIKRWAPERFAEVADKLNKKFNSKIIIFGGPGEEDLSQKVENYMKSDAVNAVGKFGLKKTAALIKKCRLFVTNDSGLMHIASAFKVPVAAIFGPTLPWKNHPWNTRYRLIRKKLECSPCYNKKINCYNQKCLDNITVEEVYKECTELLKN